MSAGLADYFFHPAVLDACFQAIGCPTGVTLRTAYLPVSIDRVAMSGRPEAAVWSHVRVDRLDGSRLRATLRVLDAGGAEIARVDGLACQAIDARAAAEPLSLASTLYAYSWLPTAGPSPAACRPARRTDPRALVSAARRFIERGTPPPAPAGIDDFLAAHVENALVDLGWPFGARRFTAGQACETLRLAAGAAPLLEGALRALAGGGGAAPAGGRWRLARTPRRRPTQERFAALVRRAPGLLAELTLLDCGGIQPGAGAAGRADAVRGALPA